MKPTPTQSRAELAAQQQNSGVPPTMRVAAEVGYVRSCAECRAIVERLAVACISDPTVTTFRLTAGRRHAHDAVDGPQALEGLTNAPVGESGAETGSQDDGELPISDENGFHPDLVAAASIPLEQSNLVNGFDYEGRA